MWIIEERCGLNFISDWAYDDRTAGEESHRFCIAANFDGS